MALGVCNRKVPFMEADSWDEVWAGCDGISVLQESKLCMGCACGRISEAVGRNFLVKFIIRDGIRVSLGMTSGVGRLLSELCF